MAGLFLTQGDRYLVMDTCDQGDLVPGFPAGGRALHTTASGSAASWGMDPVTARGGRYALCWCAGSFPCSTAEHFRVGAGVLTLLGPSAPIERTCVTGQTCELSALIGFGGWASDGDSLMALETCGVAGAVEPRFPLAGLALGVFASGTAVTAGEGPGEEGLGRKPRLRRRRRIGRPDRNVGRIDPEGGRDWFGVGRGSNVRSTPDRARLDLRSNLRSTADMSLIGQRPTPRRPRIDPSPAWARPLIDHRSMADRCRIYPSLIPSRPAVDTMPR